MAYELIGAVAGMQVARGAMEHAHGKGLMVIVPSGETARMPLPQGFRPKIWRAGKDGR